MYIDDVFMEIKIQQQQQQRKTQFPLCVGHKMQMEILSAKGSGKQTNESRNNNFGLNISNVQQ